MDNGLATQEQQTTITTKHHPRNKARILREYYRAKDHGCLKEMHRMKFLGRLAGKLSSFRKSEDLVIKDNLFMDFCIWAYFVEAIDKMTLKAIVRFGADSIDEFTSNNLDARARNEDEFCRLSWNTIAKVLEFQHKARPLYRIYVERFKADS